MYSIHVHSDARADLQRIRADDPETAATIVATLQELQGDQDLLDRLSQHGYRNYRQPDIDISKWVELWNSGDDIWRIRIFDLDGVLLPYRAIYAFLPQKSEYHVLAIVSRDFNYDRNHPISQRVLDAYESLQY